MSENNFSRLLKIEKYKLELKRIELVELQNELNDYKDKLVSYNEVVDKHWVVSNFRNDIIMLYLKSILDKIEESKNNILVLEGKINTKIQEVVEQHTEVKKYEKLIELQEKENNLQLARKEMKELDEIISVYYR